MDDTAAIVFEFIYLSRTFFYAESFLEHHNCLLLDSKFKMKSARSHSRARSAKPKARRTTKKVRKTKSKRRPVASLAKRKFVSIANKWRSAAKKAGKPPGSRKGTSAYKAIKSIYNR